MPGIDKFPSFFVWINALLSQVSVVVDHRLMMYIIRGRAIPNLIPINPDKVNPCVKGELPECRHLYGWVVTGDFLRDERWCLSREEKDEREKEEKAKYGMEGLFDD